MHTPDFVKGEYNTLFIEKNSRMLLRGNGNNEEIENIAMIGGLSRILKNGVFTPWDFISRLPI